MTRRISTVRTARDAFGGWPPTGVRDLLQLKVAAWLVRHAAGAQLTILAARRQVAEASVVAEESEAELRLRRTVWDEVPEDGQRIVGQETEVDRLLLERARLRELRFRGLPAGPSDHPTPTALPSGLEWEISDREIEALAVKAVTRLGRLTGSSAERAWAAWRRELGIRLPPYAAEEVMRRVQELRTLTG